MGAPVKELAQSLVGAKFTFEMPVRWGDLDALNHVNNTVYFRYMEEARMHCMAAAGIGTPGSDRSTVLAHTACDFLRPVSWPAMLLIDMRLLRVGRSSLEYEAQLYISGDDGGPCMRARNVIVGTHAGTGRASPWTAVELQNMAGVFTVKA